MRMSCRSLLFAFGVAAAFPTSVLAQCLFEGKAYTGGATLQMVNGLHVCTDDGHGNFSAHKDHRNEGTLAVRPVRYAYEG